MPEQAIFVGANFAHKSYPVFTFGPSLTPEQKEFFHKNGFIQFRSFVSREVVDKMIRESERIQEEWIKEDRKLVNGTPIKYGKDVDGKTIVQRFAFLNQFADVFQEFIGDPRLLKLFELNGSYESRLGVNEKDGLVFNHYVNTKDSNYSQLAWHTDVLRDIFYGNRVMPMLNLGLHLDYSSPDNGGLRLLPGTHNKGLGTLLFRKMYYLDYKEDKDEIGLTVEPGDLTIHDGRLWHRVAQSPLVGEASRRRVMYIPIICGKYEPRTEKSKPLLYQRFMRVTNR
jgi:phytanoyl-CoA hydroxylase